MKNRTMVTIALAAILILVVMCVSVVMTFYGSINAQKFTAGAGWSQAFTTADSMKIIDLTGDGQEDVFLQNQTNIRVVDASGNVILDNSYNPPLVTTMGDLNSDNVEDVLVYSPGSADVMSKGELIWSVAVTQLGLPARAAIIHFNGGVQVILGDQSGGLLGLDADGGELWHTNLSNADAIRGLDDAKVNGQTFLAAANHDGSVALFDEQGQPVWSYHLESTLRRLRSYDLDGDGSSEILVGGDSGKLVILDAAAGNVESSASLGQPITEIREAEVDAEPSSREFVAGGKEGGVWALKVNGDRLWSGSVSDKVTEITGLDLDGDGAQEVVIGDDSGGVNLFTGKNGEKFNLLSRSSGITRIDAGKLSASNQIVVADNQNVQLYTLKQSTFTPLKYTPLLVGLIISLLAIVVAWFIATVPPKPALRLAIEDQTPESLQSQRRMLKENIADVERLRTAGEMTADAYLARLKQLRGQLADNETALRKAGIPITIETMTCPHCGGTLPLGQDRCDYCGQVVIS
jgi:hypothetical protein